MLCPVQQVARAFEVSVRLLTAYKANYLQNNVQSAKWGVVPLTYSQWPIPSARRASCLRSVAFRYDVCTMHRRSCRRDLQEMSAPQRLCTEVETEGLQSRPRTRLAKAAG